MKETLFSIIPLGEKSFALLGYWSLFLYILVIGGLRILITDAKDYWESRDDREGCSIVEQITSFFRYFYPHIGFIALMSLLFYNLNMQDIDSLQSYF